jgi:large exoprotein involved in heme utilization and adhesion
VANAFQGNGGNIQITTNGIFGLKYRDRQSNDNDITASSQFGVTGNVNINNLTFTPTIGLIELPSNINDPSQTIVQGCRTYGNSRFVSTGRGGLPDDPSNHLNSHHPWTDLRDPSAFRNSTSLTTSSQANTNIPAIVEARGWRINAKGTVEIYATGSEPSTSVFSLTNCAGMSRSTL